MVQEFAIGTYSIALIALLGLCHSAACGGSASQFEVKGESRSIVELAGDWKGRYVGVDSGRKGEISFRIAVGRHTANATVLMYPAGDESEPQPLFVSFAEIGQDGPVHGTMSPYTDPRCQCQVVTEFDGVVVGDRIEGTFTTKPARSELIQNGRWWVERQN